MEGVYRMINELPNVWCYSSRHSMKWVAGNVWVMLGSDQRQILYLRWNGLHFDGGGWWSHE